ncbi:replication initiator protein WhiP [Sulfuracidifex metallicus]|uniref:Replication initiator protein WhiP n=1 Tax=Sulfuracidifex metallicus DSM 6482 = JCM 9184 TaxID=523847 RepID=A0A6A9QL68_SULME|nr:replication initiator protein WhiP [Sulfuracidifex metallicus]MUN27965.1 replication initiator protein WhiP [Sulfuracidifex metallicus DSM 6482 = JCM 9184]WOE51486.1 replication initiator protein WhiP [Sulfuracidifex metallicus DSM 6482 = JCM 9184]
MTDNDNDISEVAKQILNNEESLRGAPRSKIVEAISVLLLARPLRASEIAANLGFEAKYISSYLSYWRKKGLVYQEGGKWHLTTSGELFAKEVITNYNNSRFKEMVVFAKQILSNDQVKPSINNKDVQKTDKNEKEVLSFIEDKTNKANKKQQKSNLEECLRDLTEKLNQEENELIKFLLDKYKQWGSTYLYMDQIQEELKADNVWLFRILKGLQTKRLVYLYQDPKLGLRIGFTQSFKKRIEEC